MNLRYDSEAQQLLAVANFFLDLFLGRLGAIEGNLLIV